MRFRVGWLFSMKGPYRQEMVRWGLSKAELTFFLLVSPGGIEAGVEFVSPSASAPHLYRVKGRGKRLEVGGGVQPWVWGVKQNDAETWRCDDVGKASRARTLNRSCVGCWALGVNAS